MRKKTKYKKHPVKPDEKYNSPVVGKLINKVMSNGERRIARRIVYQTAEVVEKWYQEQQKKISQKQKEESKVSPIAEEKKSEEQVPKEEKEISETTNPPFLVVLEKAIEKVSPDFEVRRRKVGSGVHRIPVKIEKERGLKISLR
jgi:ribosomal protein S7